MLVRVWYLELVVSRFFVLYSFSLLIIHSRLGSWPESARSSLGGGMGSLSVPHKEVNYSHSVAAQRVCILLSSKSLSFCDLSK